MYRILVCDDEKDIVSALKIYLMAEGYEVFEANNGKQALQIIQEQEIHLILMDLMMPVMDGLEATRRIRSLNRPDAKTIPIFAMTANAFSDDIQNSIAAGMDAYISKPIDVAILEKTMRGFLTPPPNPQHADERL